MLDRGNPTFLFLQGRVFRKERGGMAVRAHTQSRRAPYYFLRKQARAVRARAVLAIPLLLALMVGVALARR